MNHICVLTLNGGSEVGFSMGDSTKAQLKLEFRGTSLADMAQKAIEVLKGITVSPSTQKKKPMVLVANETINQAISHLDENPSVNLNMAGDINVLWQAYTVPDFNLYDQTFTV